MNITKCSLVTALICFGLLAAAQTKKTKSTRLPRIESPSSATEVNPGAGPVIKILEQGDEGIPLAFQWQLNADTVLKKGDVIRETIAFSGGAILNLFMADDATTLKKSTDKEYKVTSRFVSFSGETAGFNVTEENGILILEHPENHEKKRYKATLDKARKKIISLENIETRKIYLPAPFEGGSVSG